MSGVPLTEKFPGSNDSKRRARGASLPVIPKLTAEAALDFVKLIHTGIGPALAVGYLVPSIANSELDDVAKANLCEEIAHRWYKHPLMFEATTIFNGGAWQTLDPERRLSLSRDKHYAELAHFLYTHDYARLEGTDLKKCIDARTAIDARLKGSENPDAPFEKALRAIQEKMEKTQRKATPAADLSSHPTLQ